MKVDYATLHFFLNLFSLCLKKNRFSCVRVSWIFFSHIYPHIHSNIFLLFLFPTKLRSFIFIFSLPPFLSSGFFFFFFFFALSRKTKSALVYSCELGFFHKHAHMFIHKFIFLSFVHDDRFFPLSFFLHFGV